MIMMAIKEIVMTNIQGEIVMMIKRMKMVMMGVVVVEYDNEKVADDDDGVMMVMTIEKNAMVIIKMELAMTMIIDKLRPPW